MRSLLEAWVRLTKPLVWKFANAYDLRINKHCLAQGQNPLVIEDFDETKRWISKSVFFNTRSGSIHVGRDTLIAEDVMILTGKHYSVGEAEREGKPLHHVPEQGRDIRIGRHCFIGSGAIIIGPVTIGDYAVVGSGSVVTRDVPERCFVAGVPAKVVSKL